jgi:pimeloyl-ACP methyl ester carboxylesterase
VHSRFLRALGVGRRELGGELAARGDPELAVGVAQVQLDGLGRHEQRLGDRWWGNHLGELRWQAEAARLIVDPVFYGRGVPRGDGRPVVLLPGFLAGDYTLETMAIWLRRLGYRLSGCGFRFNVDCSERALLRVKSKVAELHDRYGRRVAVIGQSRGGHFAKALAVRRAQSVSHVISLSAGPSRPYDISVPTLAAVAAVRAVHRRTSLRARERGCLSEHCDCTFARAYAARSRRSCD